MTERLTPLLCGACRGPVPLVDADRTPCPFCGAVVELSPAYRALVTGQRALERSASRAESWRALGRPPSPLLRFFATAFSPVSLFFFTFVASPLIGLALTLGAVLLLGALVHVQLFEVFADFPWDWAFVLVGYVFVWAGALLGVAGTRRALALGPLQAALAAKAPEREGGVATCRQCGAPLSYGPRDLGVRCAYCETDNLLTIPASWVARMRARVTASERALEDVARAWVVERARLSAFRLKLVAGLTVATVVMTLMFVAQFKAPLNPLVPGGVGTWSSLRAEHGARLHTARRQGQQWYSEVRIVSGDVAALTSQPWCGQGRCLVVVDVPTRRGEAWRAQCSPAEARLFVTTAGPSRPPEAWERDWPGTYATSPLASGTCAGVTFTAEWTGFQRVVVELQGEAVERPVSLQLRAE